MERFDFEIRGERYQFEVPPVGKTRPFFFKLSNKFGAAFTENRENLIQVVIKNLDENLWSDAVTLFTPYTWYEKDGLWPNLLSDKLHWDAKGKDALGDQYEWLRFCMQNTYSDFLARVVKSFQGTSTP